MSRPDTRAIYAECYARLRDELIDAIRNDPQRVVATPAQAHEYSAAEVVADIESGSEQLHHERIRMTAAAAAGEDIALRAALWMTLVAQEHAENHAGDMTEEIVNGEEVAA